MSDREREKARRFAERYSMGPRRMGDLLHPGNEVVDESVPVERITLDMVELDCVTALRDAGWHGVADSLQLHTEYRPELQQLVMKMHAGILAMPSTRHRVSWPATWKDHRRKARLDRLARKGYQLDDDMRPATGWRRTFWRWVYAQVFRRLAPVKYATEEVQQYASVCPHVSAGKRHSAKLCIDYFHRMQLRGEDRGLVDVDGVLARYRRADDLASQAHAVLNAGMVPVRERGFLDLHHQRQDLEGAVRYAIQLLERAMEEGNNGR